MASFAIGGASKGAADTMRVRDVFANRFAAARGGPFDLVVDLDDRAPETTLPTKDAFRNGIADVAARVASHPKGEGNTSQVFLAFTGHGITKDGVYKFLVAPAAGEKDGDAFFTGEEMIELLASVGADELVVFFQSCESGTLVDDDAADASESGELGALAQYVKDGIGEGSKKLAIVTPVNAHVLSSTAWIDVLSTAFGAGDPNADGVVRFGELRDQIERAACAHSAFTPKAIYDAPAGTYLSLPTSGLDPRFFEVGDAASMKLFTANGAAAPSTPATSELCAAATDAFAFRYRSDVSLADFFTKYTTITANERPVWSAALKVRALEQDAPATARAAVVKHVLGNMKTMQQIERRDALSTLAGAGAPLATDDPKTHASARDFIVRAIANEDSIALGVTGLERIAPKEVYGAVRTNIASTTMKRALAALRKLDAAWDLLDVPAADHTYLLGELSRLEPLVSAGARTAIARLRSRMGS